MVVLVKGTCTLGCRRLDKDGNVIEEIPAKFESGDGGSVAVCTLDDETMEQIGDAMIFGDYQHWNFLNYALQLLSPTRPGNMPDFEDIFVNIYAGSHDHDCPFRPYCGRVLCADCVCWEWIDRIEEGEE